MAAFGLALVACTADRVMGPGAMSAPTGAALASAGLGTRLVITEIMVRPTAVTDAAGEWFELYNPGSQDLDLRGYRIMSWAGSTIEKHTIPLTIAPVIVPAGKCAVIGNNANLATNGGVTQIYSYGTAITFGNSNATEALWIRSPDSLTVLDSVAAAVRKGTSPETFDRTFSIGSNFSLELRQIGTEHVIFTDTSATQPWKQATAAYSGVMKGTPGTCPPGAIPAAGPLASITITPPSASVTVGNSQTFTASGFDAARIPAATPSLTWSTTATNIATVNATTGAAKGEAIGDATIVATSGSVSAQAVVHVVAPRPTGAGLPSTRFSEIHYDNAGTDVNEAIEVEGDAGVSLDGWSIVLYTGSNGTVYRTVALAGVFTASCNGRGAIAFPIAGIQNGGFDTPEPDGFALVHGTEVVQFLSYEGQFAATDGPAQGITSIDIGVEENSSTTSTQSLALNTAGVWEKKNATFGAVNACADATGSASISISSNGPDTLVVGWQRRAFVTFRDANGTTVSPTPTITWTSDTPALASVDARGYATALAAGTAIIRATIGTTTQTYSIAVIDYEPVTAQYRSHVEFGVPTGADPANDVYLAKPGYITSYNPARGGPNWVSWNINATTFGNAERCECFSADAALPAIQRIVDYDYVSGGYDRGHMVQSDSRTSTHSENAASFLLTNILPQAANNNQGPWLGFEKFLNDRARIDGKQVYVVAGGEYAASPTTLKGEGKVAIPDFTWKVALVMNSGVGLADVHGLADVSVYAIRIPNLLATAPAKNNVYQPFLTTIDDIEARSGYDFFAALPDCVEAILESGDRRPTARFDGALTGDEGQTLTFDASTSSDPDVGTALDDVLAYQWSVNGVDGGTGAQSSVTFPDDGSNAVRLIVTDRFGWADTITKTVTIANVPPTVGSVAGATIIRGETYEAVGTFTDPGADTWTATANYGDGAGTQPLALSGKSFSLGHVYATAGTFTVTVTVRDDDGGSSSSAATVVVVSAEQAVGTLAGDVGALATAGTITQGEAGALDASLRAARSSLARGSLASARNQLEAFINKVEAMQRSGRLDATGAGALMAYARRIIVSIG